MTNKILLDKLQDCISFYKKNPGDPDLKEIVFSRLEFLDHQEFFEANVLYIGTLPRFQALYAPELASPEALFLLSETTEAQLAQLSLPASGRIMISTLPQERLSTASVPDHPSDIHPSLFLLMRSGSRFSTESWLQLMIS